MGASASWAETAKSLEIPSELTIKLINYVQRIKKRHNTCQILVKSHHGCTSCRIKPRQGPRYLGWPRSIHWVQQVLPSWGQALLHALEPRFITSLTSTQLHPKSSSLHMPHDSRHSLYILSQTLNRPSASTSLGRDRELTARAALAKVVLALLSCPRAPQVLTGPRSWFWAQTKCSCVRPGRACTENIRDAQGEKALTAQVVKKNLPAKNYRDPESMTESMTQNASILKASPPFPNVFRLFCAPLTQKHGRFLVQLPANWPLPIIAVPGNGKDVERALKPGGQHQSWGQTTSTLPSVPGRGTSTTLAILSRPPKFYNSSQIFLCK